MGHMRWKRIFSGVPYVNRVTSLVGASYLLRLWMLDEAGGTTLKDYSPNAANKASAYTGVTLGAPGPISGHTAAQYDGATSVTKVNDASFTSAFPAIGDEGFILCWLKVANLATWTDSAIRTAFRFQSGTNTSILMIRKENTNNRLSFTRYGNAVSQAVNSNGNTSVDWLCAAMTWSVAGNAFKAYLNGAQVGTTQTGLQGWVGTVAVSLSSIGVGDNVAVNEIWNGYIGPVIFGSRPISASEVAALSSIRA